MEHSALLLVELGAVLLALGLLGRVARRLSFPAIPLYLVAGLAFGEGGMWALDASEAFITTAADIGVVLLLLTLGLEYSTDELLGTVRSSWRAGVVDVVLNAVPGAVVALLLGWGPVGAVALAGVTYISSSGIAAKLLTDLGRLGNRETPSVLSLLVLEDLVMAVYLPVLSGVLLGVAVLTGALSVVVAVGTVAAVLVATSRYGDVLSRLLFSRDDEVLLLWVLGLTLLVAGVAQQLQVSAAVGAFLVGLALSGEVADAARSVLAPLRDLFAAVFFVFFGLETDPASIPPIAVVAVVLALVTAVTKVATGWWAAGRAGIGPLGRARAGAVLIPRGEFSIVVAGLAVEAGVARELGALAAAYVLLLGVLGSLATWLAEPVTERLLRRQRQPG